MPEQKEVENENKINPQKSAEHHEENSNKKRGDNSKSKLINNKSALGGGERLLEGQEENINSRKESGIGVDGGKKPDFIAWFSELNKNSGSVAGGKGANLAEIYNLKIAVPPGFVITAQAYDYFIKKAGLDEKIKELLSQINYEDTKKLTEITNQIRGLIWRILQTLGMNLLKSFSSFLVTIYGKFF